MLKTYNNFISWIKKQVENPDDSVEKQLGIFYLFLLLTIMIVATLIIGPNTFPVVAWTTVEILLIGYSGLNVVKAYRNDIKHKDHKHYKKYKTDKTNEKDNSSDDAFVDA